LLDDIEKLMKRKLEVKPLPEGDGGSSGGSGSTGSARSTSSSRSSSSASAPAKMSDPFFYMPYEPGAAKDIEANSSTSSVTDAKKVGIVPAKPTVGALLGGFKKK